MDQKLETYEAALGGQATLWRSATGCEDCDCSTFRCWRHSSYAVLVGNNYIAPVMLCHRCGGSGREHSMYLKGDIWVDTCRACGGSGRVAP
jgi:hypothetical protein